MTEALFSKYTAGAIEMSNRIVMAPLTRNRADDEDGTVNDLHVEYYRQRAGAGLIITEATQISPAGKGYIQTPGHPHRGAGRGVEAGDRRGARGRRQDRRATLACGPDLAHVAAARRASARGALGRLPRAFRPSRRTVSRTPPSRAR